MSEWIWVTSLGATGGAASVWLASLGAASSACRARRAATRRATGLIGVSAGTSAAIAWMVDGAAGLGTGAPALPTSLAFVWIGFVTAAWITAMRDVHILRQAVCRAATAPAAHPDTVSELAHASPDAVYDTVVALLPRRVAR